MYKTMKMYLSTLAESSVIYYAVGLESSVSLRVELSKSMLRHSMTLTKKSPQILFCAKWWGDSNPYIENHRTKEESI